MKSENSEQLLRNIIDSSMDMIQVFEAVRNAENEITDFVWILNNKAAEAVYGDVIGKSLLTLNPGVIQEGIFDTFKQVVATGKPDQSIRHYVHEQFNGWFHQSTVKQNDGVTTTTRDITSIKNAEQELRRKNEQLGRSHKVLNSINEACYELDENSVVTFVNRQALEWWDRSEADVLGKNIWELFPESVATHCYDAIQLSALEKNEYAQYDYISGVFHRWISLSAIPTDTGCVVIFRDIDERVKAEQEILLLKDEIAQKAETNLAKELAATKLLQNVSSKLLERDNIAELYEEIMAVSKTVMNSDAVSMQRYIPETRQLKLIVWKGFHPDAAKFWDLVDAGSGSTCGEALAKNKRIVVTDVENEKFMQGTGDLEAYRLSGIRAVQSTPLVSRSGSIVGMISNHWYKVHQPTERDFNFLDVLARQLADQIEHAHAEQALRKSEEKYRTLFNSIDEGFQLYEVLYDDVGKPCDFRYLETNPAFERQTGMKDVAGKLGSEVIPNLESYWFDYFEKILKSPEPLHAENYNQATGRWYSVSSFRAASDGRPIIGALFNDITERKQREQYQQFLIKFSDALRAEPDGDAIANRAIRMLAGHLGLDRCYVGIAVPDDNLGIFPYQVGNERVPPMPEQGVPLSDFPEAWRKTFGETLVISDFQHTAGLTETEKQNFAALGFGALVVANVRKEKKNPYWSINAVSATPRRWTPIEIHLIEDATERTWAAVERARGEEALKLSEERFRTALNAADMAAWDWNIRDTRPGRHGFKEFF